MRKFVKEIFIRKFCIHLRNEVFFHHNRNLKILNGFILSKFSLYLLMVPLLFIEQGRRKNKVKY